MWVTYPGKIGGRPEVPPDGPVVSHALRCLRNAVALEFQAEPRHGQYLTGLGEDVASVRTSPPCRVPRRSPRRSLAVAFQRFGAERATLLLCGAGPQSRGAARDPPPRPSQGPSPGERPGPARPGPRCRVGPELPRVFPPCPILAAKCQRLRESCPHPESGERRSVSSSTGWQRGRNRGSKQMGRGYFMFCLEFMLTKRKGKK